MWLYFRIGALNELQYRANFVVQIFQSAIALFTGLAVLSLVFGQTDELNGWTHAELLAVMGVHILMGGVIAMTIQPNMLKLMEDVQKGTFDYVLVKPEDAQVVVSVREVRIWSVVDVIVGAVVLAIATAQLQISIGLPQAVGLAIALLIGGLLIYCFWLLLTTMAFWVVRMDQIAELFEGVYQSGRWPVTVYPGWLRISLTFLVPIAFAVTIPAEAITGRLTIEVLAFAAAFGVVALLVTRWFWQSGFVAIRAHRHEGDRSGGCADRCFARSSVTESG
jgi:ABC-2 type transport system permease protein